MGIYDFYTFDNFHFIYSIPATECLVYSCFIKSIPISIENRCVLDNAINDNTIQILQIALKINKVIKYFNSLHKKTHKKNNKKQQHEVQWDTIIEMYSKKYRLEASIYIPLSATSDTVLRSFQYKILHRILPTNNYLFINSNLCDFWSISIETIEHIFWECPNTTLVVTTGKCLKW